MLQNPHRKPSKQNPKNTQKDPSYFKLHLHKTTQKNYSFLSQTPNKQKNPTYFINQNSQLPTPSLQPTPKKEPKH